LDLRNKTNIKNNKTMNKLEEVKIKTKELIDLLGSYEAELINMGIERGKEIVLQRVANSYANEMQNNKEIIGKDTKELSSDERLLTAFSVIKELFPELANK
jgi:hypothetical protein